MVLVFAVPGWAASPSSGSVGPANASTGWSGQSFAAGATASPAACGAGGDALCDHYSLSVPVFVLLLGHSLRRRPHLD